MIEISDNKNVAKNEIIRTLEEYPFIKSAFNCRIRLINKTMNKQYENHFTVDEILNFNQQGFDIYFVVNDTNIQSGFATDNAISKINYLFADCDLKDKIYQSKNEFLSVIKASQLIPIATIDSGNGIHVYYNIIGLPVYHFKSYQTRLATFFKTDRTINNPSRIMRLPYTYNVKEGWDNRKLCYVIEHNPNAPIYTPEHFDTILPILPKGRASKQLYFENEIILSNPPRAFSELLKVSSRMHSLYQSNSHDRSKDDYELGCILLEAGFTPLEIASVINSSSKAYSLFGQRRQNYVALTVDKLLSENKNMHFFNHFHSLQRPQKEKCEE